MSNEQHSGELEFDDLLAQYTERVRNGEKPPIIDYLNRYPNLAEEINEFFPVIMQLEEGKNEAESEESAGRWKFPVIEKLGDYLLVREIGRGGMGVVYEARQSSLDRRVALKVLKEELVDDPKNLARFQREGRMAAMLHHANIVPVLGTGSERGSNYIVMQMVEGVGLDRIIHLMIGEDDPAGPDTMFESADPPPPQDEVQKITVQSLLDDAGTNMDWRKFAAMSCQIASALSHAHQQQLIHRDIKPSNLIVDRQGKPWVVDFGLARNFNSGDDFSRVAGTPRYMAPEQMVGNATAQSDIFGLGLSLYELASHTRVYENSAEDQADFLPESRNSLTPLNELVPGIPKDLHRILMKCVSLEPDHRYQSAADLTEDLERFLENRPLANVRVSPIDRARRWAQRNPSTAIASAIATILLIGIAILSSVNYWNQHNQLVKSEATLQVSIDALDTVYNRLAPDADSNELFSSENAELLNELLQSYDRLAQLDTQNTELKQTAAEVNYRVGEINRRLGRGDKALVAFDRSIEIFNELQQQGDDQESLATVQIARGMVGKARVRAGSPEEGFQRMQDALDWIDLQLIAAQKSGSDIRADLQFEKARALFYLSVTPRRPTADLDSNPGDASANKNHLSSPSVLSRSIVILEQWQEPKPERVRALLAKGYSARSQQFDDPDFNDAIAIQESLVSEFPESKKFQITLVEIWAGIAPQKLAFKDFPRAAENLREAARLAKNFSLADVNVNQIVGRLYHKLALFYGRLNESESKFSRSQIGTMLGNSARKPLDQAILYGQLAVELEEQYRNIKSAETPTASPRELGWLLNLRLTLCKLLWARNLGTDRQQALKIIEQSQAQVGSINLSSKKGRALAVTLKQLSAIPRR